MAIATASRIEVGSEPIRTACGSCEAPVLIAIVPALARIDRPALIVTAEPYEWEPRAACQSCAWTRARLGRPADCPRCGGSGYVGLKRPRETMLAVDIAWSDEGHIRLVGERTARRKGEALYRLHLCDDQSAIVPC